MVEHTWSKPGGAVEVSARVRLEPEALALLAAGHTPAEFVAVLVDVGHHADAARFAAFALPRRAAVGWACRCVRAALGADAPATAWDALAAAERWVAAPSEANRRAAFVAAEAAEFGTAAGCCAAAAFWSGGSLAPEGLPVVPPPEHLLHGAVAAAVILAVAGEPATLAGRFQAFLKLAADVALDAPAWPATNPQAEGRPRAGRGRAGEGRRRRVRRSARCARSVS